MIYFERNTPSQIILTLQEKVTIPNPYYWFVFTHRGTNQIANFLLSSEDDETEAIERYNQFTILPNVRFVDIPDGELVYTIYQVTSPITINENVLLETGIARLYTTDNFEYTQYETNNTFITR